MSFFIIDVEADGPIPGKYSMVSFGAVKVDDNLNQTFYGETKPISDIWVPDALKVSGFSREDHLGFNDPEQTMIEFRDWIEKTNYGTGRPIFMSDNPCFDWQFINYYFCYYLGDKGNPFGYSGRRIGDLYCGLVKDGRAQWKHLRNTKHDHNPVNDAMGNAEVVLHMRDKMGLRIGLK